jgi:hypothetical protein
MKSVVPLFVIVSVCLTAAAQEEAPVPEKQTTPTPAATEQVPIADDNASNAAYNDGWTGGDNGGTGFGEWTQHAMSAANTESHAGFFIANKTQNPDLNNVDIGEKAFGLYANGTAFEAAVAFRPIQKPLAAGESFSFLMEHAAIERKFDADDPATGGVGLTLRTGNASGNSDDYNKGSRFEFGFYEGQTNYQVFDGEASHDTGVAYTDAGVTVTFTLATADTYDLEITTMGDRKTTKLTGRKLMGNPGGAVESFVIFARDTEKYDAFFNGFQVLKPAQ